LVINAVGWPPQTRHPYRKLRRVQLAFSDDHDVKMTAASLADCCVVPAVAAAAAASFEVARCAQPPPGVQVRDALRQQR